MDKICGIYKIISPTGRVYIGESKDVYRRFKTYRKLRCKTQVKLYNSFLKYGTDGHTFDILEECAFEDLKCRERYWQDFYNVLNKGLNLKLTECGELKQIPSKETLKRMSIAQSGENHPMYGKTHSESTKQQMSESVSGERHHMYGKHHTEESKQKISGRRLEYLENNPPVTGKDHHLFKDKVGEVWSMVNSGDITITEYFKYSNCTIQFEDGTIRKNVQYGLIKKGYIKK
jgi:group I intron endonuclease